MKHYTQRDIYHYECNSCGAIHTFARETDVVIRITCYACHNVIKLDNSEVEIHYEEN